MYNSILCLDTVHALSILLITDRIFSCFISNILWFVVKGLQFVEPGKKTVFALVLGQIIVIFPNGGGEICAV